MIVEYIVKCISMPIDINAAVEQMRIFHEGPAEFRI
jgi:hypothetical protein